MMKYKNKLNQVRTSARVKRSDEENVRKRGPSITNQLCYMWPGKKVVGKERERERGTEQRNAVARSPV